MGLKPGYKRTEVGIIPQEWQCHRLSELTRIDSPICYGIVQPGPYVENGIPVLAIKNLNTNYHTNVHRSSASIEKEYARSRIRPGDVLVSVKGTTGRVGMVPEHFHGNISRDLARIRLSDENIPGFCFQMLQSGMAKRCLQIATVGTTRSELSISILKQMKVVRPPKDEQRAIAAVLSDVDALIGALDQLIAKKRDLKQSAMQQLLTGRHRLPGFSGEWEVKRLGDCLSSAPAYGINAPAVPFSDKLPAYIRITDITEDGRFRPEKPVSVKQANAGNYYLTEGDLVFARTGASVGKSYLYDLEDGNLVFAGFLIRIQPDPVKLVASYLAAYVRTGAYWNWVRLMSMRSGQPGINGNEYGQMLIALPTPSEQVAIAGVLSDMDAEIATLEARRDKTRALKQGMMQELLTGRIRLV